MSEPSAAERALFAQRRGVSSTVIAIVLQALGVIVLLVVAKVRGDVRTRPPTRTMVEFTAPPPRREDTPPPPPPPPPSPPPRPRPRPIARPAPVPAPPTPTPTPAVHEAPPVMTGGHGSRGERMPTGYNTAFHGGETRQGAQGNAPMEAQPAPPTPAPPAPPRGPIQLPEDGTPPEPLDSNVPPEYPADAREQGIEAVVIATVVISAEGRVTRVVIRRGHPLFDDAVRRALLSWRYTPARVAGEPVEVYWNVRVPFRLQAN